MKNSLMELNPLYQVKSPFMPEELIIPHAQTENELASFTIRVPIIQDYNTVVSRAFFENRKQSMEVTVYETNFNNITVDTFKPPSATGANNQGTADWVDEIMKRKPYMPRTGRDQTAPPTADNRTQTVYLFDVNGRNNESELSRARLNIDGVEARDLGHYPKGIVGNAAMSYKNSYAVHALYKYSEFNWILGFFGICIVFGVYTSFAFGLVQRLMELIILYCISPLTLALYPMDDGASFKSNFAQPFYKKVIAVYAVVLSLNLFFLLFPYFSKIKFFNDTNSTTNWMMNNIMSVFLTIALLSLLPKIRNTIQTMLGADSIEEKSLAKMATDTWGELRKGGAGIAVAGAGLVAKGVRYTGVMERMNLGNKDKNKAWKDLTAGQKASRGIANTMRGAAWFATLGAAGSVGSGDKWYNSGWGSKAGRGISDFMGYKTVPLMTKDANGKEVQAVDAAGNKMTKRVASSGISKFFSDAYQGSLMQSMTQAAFDLDNGVLMQGKAAKALVGYFGEKEKIADMTKYEKDRKERINIRADVAGEKMKAAQAAKLGVDSLLQRIQVAGKGLKVGGKDISEFDTDDLFNKDLMGRAIAAIDGNKPNSAKELGAAAVTMLGGGKKLKAALKQAGLGDDVYDTIARGNAEEVDKLDLKNLGSDGAKIKDIFKGKIDGVMSNVTAANLGGMLTTTNLGGHADIPYMGRLLAELGQHCGPEFAAALLSGTDADIGKVLGSDKLVGKMFENRALSEAAGACKGDITKAIGIGHAENKRQAHWSSIAADSQTKIDFAADLQKDFDDFHNNKLKSFYATGHNEAEVKHLAKMGSFANGVMNNRIVDQIVIETEIVRKIREVQGSDQPAQELRQKYINELKDIEIDIGSRKVNIKQELNTTFKDMKAEDIAGQLQKEMKDFYNVQFSKAVEGLSSSLASYDFSVKANQRMGGMVGAAMSKELMKHTENLVNEMNVNNKNTIIKDTTFTELFESGKNAEIAHNLRLVADGRCADSKFKDNAEMMKMSMSAKGRQDARRMTEIFGNMLGDAKGAMGGDLALNAQNITGMLVQTAMIEQVQNMIDGVMQENTRMETHHRQILEQTKSKALATMSRNSFKGSLGAELSEAIRLGQYNNQNHNKLFNDAIEQLNEQVAKATGVEKQTLMKDLDVLTDMLGSRTEFYRVNYEMDHAAAFRGKLQNFEGFFRRLFKNEGDS